MVLRILAALAVLVLAAHPAAACRFKPMSFDAALERAETAFIGTVKSVEDRTVTWAVETGIKGLNDGAAFTSQIGGESCDIRFEAGQRWMYLGSTHPSGSLFLQDARGNRNEANYKTVNDKFSGAAESVRKTLALTGTLERDCAPWDGSAYTIRLANGIVASVYGAITDLEHKDRKEGAVFPADMKAERNHGQILRCPPDKTDAPCQFLQGTITMGPIDSQSAKGTLEFMDGETKTYLLFDVKRVEKQVFCG